MDSPFPLKDRFIIGGGYLLPMVFPVPLLTLVFVYIYYYFLGGVSRFVNHHLKQSFNVVASYHLYTLVLFLFFYLLTTFGDLFGNLFADNVFVGMFIVMGSISSFFLIFLFSIIIYVVLIVAIILAFFGKWVRIPLIIKFIK
ncbi:hypothetical protein LGQ02_12880 [Bacillus shivajii]|uniref:hypothetical protein n=1 Tax=Bacillus shivajii TaxID=1983719 RepID=UPI001CFAD999|nr:hypothetical protein [Bacillus shivajii]UCZ51755.1 hypothetical protein LGQ02_12880 [Bacillus shivajii]